LNDTEVCRDTALCNFTDTSRPVGAADIPRILVEEAVGKHDDAPASLVGE
jgi:hypothetical protein